jgi:predicted transcriptional regulator
MKDPEKVSYKIKSFILSHLPYSQPLIYASRTSVDNRWNTRKKERHDGKGRPTRAVLFSFDMEIRAKSFYPKKHTC